MELEVTPLRIAILAALLDGPKNLSELCRAAKYGTGHIYYAITGNRGHPGLDKLGLLVRDDKTLAWSIPEEHQSDLRELVRIYRRLFVKE